MDLTAEKHPRHMDSTPEIANANTEEITMSK